MSEIACVCIHRYQQPSIFFIRGHTIHIVCSCSVAIQRPSSGSCIAQIYRYNIYIYY